MLCSWLRCGLVNRLLLSDRKVRWNFDSDVYDIIAKHSLYEDFVIEGKRIEAGELIVENFQLVPKG